MEMLRHVILHVQPDVWMKFLVAMTFASGSTATYVMTDNAMNATPMRHVRFVGRIPTYQSPAAPAMLDGDVVLYRKCVLNVIHLESVV